MVDVWTTTADISNGYVPPSSVWSALMGAEGNLDFLLHRGWQLVNFDSTEYSKLGAAGDVVTWSGLNIPPENAILIIGAQRKSAASDTWTLGIKTNGVVNIEANNGAATFARLASTAVLLDGMFVAHIHPRTSGFLHGFNGLSIGRASADGAGDTGPDITPDANSWTNPFPAVAITSITLRGATGGSATGYVKDVGIWQLGVTL